MADLLIRLAEKCKLAKEENDKLIKRLDEKRKQIKNLNPLLDSILTVIIALFLIFSVIIL